MSESNTNNRDLSDQELSRLAAISDDDIDTSDIAEAREWSRAERGKFYRSESADNVLCVSRWGGNGRFSRNARPRWICPFSDLASETLKKNIELNRAVELGQLVVCVRGKIGPLSVISNALKPPTLPDDIC